MLEKLAEREKNSALCGLIGQKAESRKGASSLTQMDFHLMFDSLPANLTLRDVSLPICSLKCEPTKLYIADNDACVWINFPFKCSVVVCAKSFTHSGIFCIKLL